ncbi:MAG: translation elongation factor 4 [Patescibacteria group bacterium]|nr:translation elongation factor 4 [Patescibacteria group bacterium]MCL5262006.1 translation elongation factor 4 [Patescibacteria group bacterium]
MENIRNFVIIAHIDHGKSTLADRMLEITGTVPKRLMRPQYLDQMELERERGITIKMTPVRMIYCPGQGSEYIFNLIDTPGHSDFGYEVSRALKAVEGAVLLVDATQGVQAQTLANFEAARKAGLKIIGCVNKIDLNPPDLEKKIGEVAKLLGEPPERIYRVSGKTGAGVAELLRGIADEVPAPTPDNGEQALIFDSVYNDHKGIIAYVRVFSGEFAGRKETRLVAADRGFGIKEVGIFNPEFKPTVKLTPGEIGYIATGIKDPGVLRIGDTIGTIPLEGYNPPKPVVFVSLYPDEGDKYDDLKAALNKLRLVDSSISVEPDYSEILGRGFKTGFLGRLHFEIATERLNREFNLPVVTSFPSVAYRVKTKTGVKMVESPKDFPDENLGAEEPIVSLKIIVPQNYLGKVLGLKDIFRMEIVETEVIDDRIVISAKMPLSELISDFDDRLKSVSLGYASFSYEIAGWQDARVEKMRIMVANETVPGLTRIVYKDELDHVARTTVEELKNLLPKQLFSQPIQAAVGGKIVARETIPAMRKELGNFGKTGGDRTRKMKLWKKQQAGKKRLQASARVTISPEIFKELLKK